MNNTDFISREVSVGTVIIGGSKPIRIQSMTTTDTRDTASTVGQCLKLVAAGCEIIRITAPSLEDARNLSAIKQAIRSKGCKTPLIADIHYTPNAALIAARIVEKVRINPGNYADRKRFATKAYTDRDYEEELQRIRERFLPLVKICSEEGTAMRIGTNHGSLSDRIMNRYGDTPEGMVESALEFVRICRDEGFHELVLSMKASNPLVMMQANRLLVSRMIEEGMDYPIHLGVTEAGGGMHGRVKSAIGIGRMLAEGIGDTIRVSLTEEPENEVPFARILAEKYGRPFKAFSLKAITAGNRSNALTARNVLNIGGKHPPVVICDLSKTGQIRPQHLGELGYQFNKSTADWKSADNACDYIYIGEQLPEFPLPQTLGVIRDYKAWLKDGSAPNHFPIMDAEEFLHTKTKSAALNLVDVGSAIAYEGLPDSICNDPTTVLLLRSSRAEVAEKLMNLLTSKAQSNPTAPVIIASEYCDLSSQEFLASASCELGGLLIDGFGDGIFIMQGNCCSPQFAAASAFGILQCSRRRITETDYISCPSCGRTLFDLQETTKKIHARTGHLKGLKIGIMGCIVNGPGEMADADYGYVGTGPGVITLYKGREVVKRNIPEHNAVEALLELIKANGDWQDAPSIIAADSTSNK